MNSATDGGPKLLPGPVGPLVGTREVAQPCDQVGTTAQQPLAGNDLQLMRTPGVPLRCAAVNNALRWVNF